MTATPAEPTTAKSAAITATNSRQSSSTTQQHLHLNWSNFKPEFSGIPDEDAEAHLLCSNDWMNAHHFVDGVKV